MSYIQPVFPVLLLSVLALSIRARSASGRRRWPLLAAASLLLLFSWPPVAWVTTRTLEARYATDAPALDDVGAIVVLAGWVGETGPGAPEPVVGPDTYRRCRYGAWLYRERGPKPVLVCGGGTENGGGPVAAEAMRGVLTGAGVPAGSVWLEGRSTSTRENAVLAARILEERGVGRIALVTDAYHMPRAERAFRKAGLEVVPVPCAFRRPPGRRDLVPTASAALANGYVVHEWVGLCAYLVRGWI